MRITFTETESSERSYFEQELGDHELNFVPALTDVPADTRATPQPPGIISIWIVAGAAAWRSAEAASCRSPIA
jgi:hypothetical protein